jgi:hypothetical protein
MMTTMAMLAYLVAHPSLPETDAAMAQAIVDGYARWDGTAWLLKGRILPGERRVVRYDDGTSREETG